jgi:short-subunit dehydrogenase
MEARNVILTGASHGIGPYIARALAARRANLLLEPRSEPELAQLPRE